MNAQRNIVVAFDHAATTYDAASQLQQQVARHLVDHADAENPQTILDIGCGTGHVSALAAAHWPNAHLTAIDSSASMLEQARKKVPDLHIIHNDAAAIDDAGHYDLIFTSMLLHWLPDPRAVLQKWRGLLSPRGKLCVALPVAGSLREWRALCGASSAPDSVWAFPSPLFADDLADRVEVKQHALTYPSLYDFLKQMKQTGAHSARPDSVPLPAAQMRRLLAENARPFSITYNILYLLTSAT